MLKIKNLEAGYGKLRVLKRISMHIDSSEIVTIIGANGAGKTTLLYTIAGMIKAAAGDIVLYDQNITQTKPEKIVAAGCSLVPEGRQVFSTLSVQENLILGGYVQKKRNIKQREELQKIYDIFPVLKEREHQLSGTLSGGEQQRVCIARALVNDPRILLADEPTGNLDQKNGDIVLKLIRELHAEGHTIVLITHNPQIGDMGQNKVVLVDGKIKTKKILILSIINMMSKIHIV